MVSTPERFTYNSPISPGPSVTDKNTSASKSLHQFTELLYVKQKTSIRLLGSSKSDRKAVRSGSMLWYIIQNRLLHKKLMNTLKNILIILFYEILRLFSTQ